ncbi:MAG: sigma 54-interacting transcriptional regulator [Polyangiaceae bacterium]|nr:sigma 54-interacting transcriptional regulator [Polyangiaceae bacterium]
MSNDHDSSAHGGRDSATRPSASREHDAGRLEISVERERGGERPRRCTTDGLRRVRIGASPSCDVVLDDPEVSRIHCEIRSRGTAWELVDLGSLNGTFADGLRIRDADLPERDVVVSLGSSSLRVRAGAAKPSEGSAHTTLGPVVFGRLYGASQPMRRLFARVERIASTETDVLIEGESGTGKELVTAEIVSRSKRAKAPLIIVDCGALAPSLVESELFGHKKGAFTGADRDRAGAFELADGGTVFLDEIGELPLALQPKLLRALAAREIRRLGETTTRTVDVRVIAATNRRLEVEVNQGRFREDLYFRLSVIRVDVPSLRERLEDIPLLVGSFLQQLDAAHLLERFTPELFAELRGHTWPGNVRELKNWVERYAILEERDLPQPSKAPVGEGAPPIDLALSYSEAKAQVILDFERRYLSQILEAAGGNVSKAARIARMDRMHFHKLVQRHDLRRATSLDD